MFPEADPSAPQLLGAVLRVGLAVVLLAAAGWGWVAWLKRGRGSNRRLEVKERAFLTRGAGVALLRVDDRDFLVGVSAEGVRLIHDLDGEPGSRQATFAGILADVEKEAG